MLLGARIEPRLLDHLLNELGDRFDRLPVLQHALLRTWDAWQRSGGVGAIDFPHYDAAGRLDGALDRDAEGALHGPRRRRHVRDLQAADRYRPQAAARSQPGARQPADGGVPAPIAAPSSASSGGSRRTAGASSTPRRTAGPDDPRVDISHESLIRQWDRLRRVGGRRARVARSAIGSWSARARKRERGAAALLQDPELRAAADWRDQAQPSPAWAERYSDAEGDFACAIAYLDASVAAQCHTLAEAELARRWKIWNPLILVR